MNVKLLTEHNLVSKLERRLQRLGRVYTCKNVKIVGTLTPRLNYFMIEVMSTIHIVVHVVVKLLLANLSHSQEEYRFCLKTIITL